MGPSVGYQQPVKSKVISTKGTRRACRVMLSQMSTPCLGICIPRDTNGIPERPHNSLPFDLNVPPRQTALHYAYSYGFESLGEYLISKGADDSITNADGLTCYEGLNQTSLQHL